MPPPLVAGSLLMVRMIASWILTIGGIGLFIKELLRENRRELKVVAIFGLSIFFFAQAQNIYVQPQDPQFQVQPMFIITLGLIICYFQDSVKKYVKSLLPILVLIIGMDNFIMLQPFRGADAIMVKNFAEFRDHFPKNSTKIVHLGYEQWSSWLMLFDYESSWNMYLKDITTLNSPFHFKHGISIQEAANQITDEIDAALISGKRVIVTSPWVNDSSNEYIYELAALNLTKEQLIQYKEILLKPYQIKNVYTLKWGKFAEIEKKK